MIWLWIDRSPEPMVTALAALIAIISQLSGFSTNSASDAASGREVMAAGRALVVLPFENVSPDPDDEFFVDGLTAEITSDLSAIDAFNVLSRTSAMAMKGSAKDLRSIGRELGVQYVLEGTVRRAEDRLRITAQLVDAETDIQLWSEKYDGQLSDVFRMQEDVSASIAAALSADLSESDSERIEHHPVADPRAYDLYLRARGEYGRQSKESIGRAIRHLEGAVSIVGDNSLLFTSLGQAHSIYGSLVLGAEIHHKHLDLAEDYARRALAIEPEFPRALGLLGFILYDRFETAEGLRHMAHAAELAPDDYDNLNWAVLAFSMCGKDARASGWANQLLEHDPLNAFTQFVVGEHHLFAGRWDRAEVHLRRANQLDPGGPNHRTALGQLLGYTGRVEDAIEQLTAPADELSPNLVWDLVGQVFRYSLAGDHERARTFLTDELREDAKSDMLFSWLLADCYALLGQTGEAMAWLDNAIRGGFLNRTFFAERDPWLAGLSDRTDFRRAMEQLDRQAAQLEV